MNRLCCWNRCVFGFKYSHSRSPVQAHDFFLKFQHFRPAICEGFSDTRQSAKSAKVHNFLIWQDKDAIFLWNFFVACYWWKNVFAESWKNFRNLSKKILKSDFCSFSKNLGFAIKTTWFFSRRFAPGNTCFSLRQYVVFHRKNLRLPLKNFPRLFAPGKIMKICIL